MGLNPRLKADRIALLLMAGIVLLVAAYGYRGSQFAILGPPFNDLGTQQDLNAYLEGAQQVADGRNPYTKALELESGTVSQQMFETVEIGSTLYVYPPVLAVILSLWLGQGVTAITHLWGALNLLLVPMTVLLVVHIFADGVSRVQQALRFTFLILLSYFFLPFQHVWSVGQVDLLILFLLLLAFAAYRRGWSIAAGLSLAFALSIKPLVLLIVLYFVWKGKWRTVLTAGIGAAALVAIGFSVVGWQRLPDYLEVNRFWSGPEFGALPVNQSPRGVALRFFTENTYIEPLAVIPWLATVLTLVPILAAVGGWLWCVPRQDAPRERRSALAYGLIVTSYMLVSPLAEPSHYVWMLLPLAGAILVKLDDLRRPSDWLWLGAFFACALYLGYPALQSRMYSGYEAALSNQLVERSHLLWTGVYLYGLLVFYALYGVYLRRQSVTLTA